MKIHECPFCHGICMTLGALRNHVNHYHKGRLIQGVQLVLDGCGLQLETEGSVRLRDQHPEGRDRSSDGDIDSRGLERDRLVTRNSSELASDR